MCITSLKIIVPYWVTYTTFTVSKTSVLNTIAIFWRRKVNKNLIYNAFLALMTDFTVKLVLGFLSRKIDYEVKIVFMKARSLDSHICLKSHWFSLSPFGWKMRQPKSSLWLQAIRDFEKEFSNLQVFCHDRQKILPKRIIAWSFLANLKGLKFWSAQSHTRSLPEKHSKASFMM